MSSKIAKKKKSELNDRALAGCINRISILAMLTLYDEFDFTEEQLIQFMQRFMEKSECLADDYTTWDDTIKILADECGIDIKFVDDGKVFFQIKP